MGAAIALYKDFPLATCYFPLAPDVQFHLFYFETKIIKLPPFDKLKARIIKPPN